MEQFWRSTPKLFFNLLDTAVSFNKGTTEPKAKHVEYYDDLPPGIW